MVTTHPGAEKGAKGSLERLDVAFDDERAVANAGLLVTATLAERLGLEAVADQRSTWACARARRDRGARS